MDSTGLIDKTDSSPFNWDSIRAISLSSLVPFIDDRSGLARTSDNDEYVVSRFEMILF
jgi:hypothetical protein